MEPTLRPLTLGEILDRTAQLYRTNFLLLAGISAVYAGALMVMSLLQIGVQTWMKAHQMTGQIVWATIAGVLVMWPVIVVAGGLAVAANNRAVAWLHLGQPATIRGAYQSILPRLGRYLWLMTITTCVVWVPFVLLYAGYVAFMLLYLKPAGVFGQAAPAAMNQDPQKLLIFGGVTLAFGLLLLVALVYAILMGLRYALAVPACVIEDLKARQAIRRSIELTKGARGRIFILGLLVVAIEMGLGLITQVFFMVSIFKHHGDLPALTRVLQQIVAFFTNAFVGPIYATGFTLFYYDQRVRKEGFDIEWMMQAAGLETPQPEASPLADGPAPLAAPDSGSAHE